MTSTVMLLCMLLTLQCLKITFAAEGDEDIYSLTLYTGVSERIETVLENEATLNTTWVYYINGGYLSGDCRKDLQVMVAAGSDEDEDNQWLKQMYDSNGLGKTYYGEMSGNINKLGNIQQCTHISKTYKKYEHDGEEYEHDFGVQYSRAFYKIAGVMFSGSMCLPKSCTGADANIIAKGGGGLLPTHVFVQEEQPNMFDDPGFYVGIVIFSLFGVLVFIGTILHYVYYLRYCCEANSSASPKKTAPEPIANDAANHNGTAVNSQDTANETAIPMNGMNPSDDAIVAEVPPKNTASDGEGNTDATPAVVTTKEEKKTPNKCVDLLVSFSIVKNIETINNAANTPGYGCLHGVRFLSMAWIVLGHCQQLGVYILFDEKLQISENQWSIWEDDKIKHQTLALIGNMNLAVESFFVLSAALTTISLMKTLDRQNGRPRCKQMALYYFHRWWRLTPVYVIIMIFCIAFFQYLGDSPQDKNLFQLTTKCRDEWWANIFYINNFIGGGCMGWCWYLANDFQFYIAAPLFIILLYKVPKAGIPVTIIAIIVGTPLTVLIINLVNPRHNWFWDVYAKPYCRFGSYGIGILLGYIMFKTKCKIRIHTGLVVLGYIIANGCMVVAIWMTDKELGLAHAILKRICMALFVSWYILACSCGYGGYINSFLSWKIFMPLGRLTYVGYLIHPIIIYYHYHYRYSTFYDDQNFMGFLFGGVMFYTVIFSFLITILFELPFLEMEKIMFPKRGK